MTNSVKINIFCFLLSGAALVAIACAAEDDREFSGVESNEDVGVDAGGVDGEGESVPDSGYLKAAGCAGVDILFVVDNSSSMLEEQANLTANFPEFVRILDDYQASGSAPLGYRIAVTTTSVNRKFEVPDNIYGGYVNYTITDGDDGVMRGPKCGLSQRWVEGPAAGVVDAFGCMAAVGADGTGWEMPLAAMELALGENSAPGRPNDGFYRRDSDTLLAVVFITDEDDCSIGNGGRAVTQTITTGISRCIESSSHLMAPTSATKEFLDDLTGGDGHYVLATIAGPQECQFQPTNQCVSQFGEAIWASRLEELSDQCGEYGVFGNIGTGDLGASLREALGVMKDACDQFSPI